MIRIKNNRVAATLAILLALGFTLPSGHASNLWIEVHPPSVREAVHGIELIHFIDANTGWAEAQGFTLDDQGTWLGLDEEILMRTSDGGASWRRANPPPVFHEYLGYRRTRTHFVSPQSAGNWATTHRAAAAVKHGIPHQC